MSPTISDASKPEPAGERALRRRKLWVPIAVLAVCVAPLVASYALFFYGPPERRMNYGELIEPRPLPDAALKRLDGGELQFSELRGRWILVQIDSSACGESCRRKLYFMRQVRLAQGRHMDRVERMWLVTDDKPVDAELLRAYEGTRVLRAGTGSLLAEFPATDAPGEHIYLIDPLGNLMLRFPRDPDPSLMKKDLERLLKVSQVG